MDLDYARFFLALMFVVGLIGLLALLLRRIGLGGVRLSPAFRGKSKTAEKRLAVTEAIAIDARRRLVLVRRDDVEHLILLSGSDDLVVETNIPARTTADSSSASFDSALRSVGESRQ